MKYLAGLIFGIIIGIFLGTYIRANLISNRMCDSIVREQDKLLSLDLTCQDLSGMQKNLNDLEASAIYLVNFNQIFRMVEQDDMDLLSKLTAVVDQKIDVAGCKDK